MKLSNFIKGLIIFFLIVVSVLFATALKNYLSLVAQPFCQEKDVYLTSEWSECSKEGVQYRDVNYIDNDSCRLPKENIKEPDHARACIYIDLGNKKITKLLNQYETIIDINGNTAASNNNLSLSIKGKVKNASLSITGKTQVLGGNIIKIADNYGFYLHIDSDGIPRAIGTSRVGGNLVVDNAPGMFKGLDTPKTLTFDLSDLQLAKSSKEGDGFIKKNFVEILNNYSGKSVDMTLFMAGGGKSMREADPKKRIYAVIESAFIEYECVKDSACEIVAKAK